MKKVLSLVLVIAMVLSSMSFAFAGTFSDIADSDYEKAIETLAALGVLSGYPDGTFGPGRTITRAELAKVLVEALGYGELVAGASNVFPDTADHWAKGYIAIASGTGLVLGYPDGTFRPENPVTFDETYTMVIRALGYTDLVLSGNWPTNYKVKAIDLGLNDDVVMAKAQADRGAVAKIFYNALEEKMVEIDEDGIAVPATPEKLFIDNIATPDKSFDVTTDTIDEDSKNFAGEIVDLTPYLYENISVYLNDDDQVVYVKGTNNLVLNGILNGAADLTEDSIIVEDAEEDDYEFELVSGTEYFINGAEDEVDNLGYEGSNVKVKVVLDAEDDDKLKDGYEVIGVVAEKQTKAALIADEYVAGKDNIDVFDLPIDDDDEVVLEDIVVKGDAESLEDIQEDDVVVEFKAYDDSKTTLVVTRNTVEGKVTRIDDKATGKADDFYVDGKKYTESLTLGASCSAELGDVGTFYLDQDGKIVAFELTKGDAKYAVVKGVEPGETKGSFNTITIKDYPQIQLATEDNEVVVYDLFVKLSSTTHKITDSVKIVDGDDTVKAYVGDTVYGNETSITSSAISALEEPVVYGEEYTDNQLVKYRVNSNNQITEIELVGVLKAFDEDSSKYVFTEDAVIFNGTDSDFEVVSEGRLEDTGDAVTVYSKDGKIAVMLTDDVKAGSDTVWAYVDKVNATENADDVDVETFVQYLRGEKVEYLTDEDAAKYLDDVDSDDRVNVVFMIELDGELVVDWEEAEGEVGDVTTISTTTNSFVFDGERVFLTDDATILEVDGETEKVVDLYDIKGEEVTVYFNDKGNVEFVVLDAAEDATPDPEVEPGEITYINSTSTRVVIDGKTTLVFDSNSEIYNEEGEIIAVGYEDIDALEALAIGDLVEDIVVENGVVVSLVKVLAD